MPVLGPKDKALRRPVIAKPVLVTVDDSDGNPYFDQGELETFINASYPTTSECGLDLTVQGHDEPVNYSSNNLTIDTVFDDSSYPSEYILQMNAHLANIYQYPPLVGLNLTILPLGG